MSPPVLELPTESDQFILDTDASQESIGAVLSVLREGRECVVDYAGRTLNKNQLNYYVTRKELLAIVDFTRHFWQYLLGKSFIIRTDHAALTWLQRMSEAVGQNARWLELLGEYAFVMQHRRGTFRGNADAISCHPCLKKPSCTVRHQQEDAFRCAVTTTTAGGDGDQSSDGVDGCPVICSCEELSCGQLNDPASGASFAYGRRARTNADTKQL